MSTSLRWRRVADRGSALKDYDFRLKEALRMEFGPDQPYLLTPSSQPFIRGLKAAGLPGAEELLELLGKHSLHVWEES